MDENQKLNNINPKQEKFRLSRKTTIWNLLGEKFLKNIFKKIFTVILIFVPVVLGQMAITKRDYLVKILKKIWFTICSVGSILLSLFLLHRGRIAVGIFYYFVAVIIANIAFPKISGLLKSTYLPTNDEEAEKLNIKNLQDYLNFVDNYLTNKNFFIEMLCLNANIRETLFLNEEHIQYIKKLSLKDKDVKKAYIAKNSKNMKCDRFSTVISNEEEIVIFNTKYVYYNNSFDKVRDAA